MRKWVKTDKNSVIQSVYTCETEQHIDKEIDASFVDTDIVGMQYVSFDTIIDYIPKLTFEEQKQAKIKALHDKYQAEYDAYLAKYPKREVDSFDDKRREALAYSADNTSPTPVIDSIVAGYNGAISKESLVASIIAKVQYIAKQEGKMVAKRDAIKACTTQEELEAIEI